LAAGRASRPYGNAFKFKLMARKKPVMRRAFFLLRAARPTDTSHCDHFRSE
jgi:hypothetical protein